MQANSNLFTETNLIDPIAYSLKLMSRTESISLEKKEAARNLYLSGIGEEFIAMQLDLEIPIVIQLLKELGVYKSSG